MTDQDAVRREACLRLFRIAARIDEGTEGAAAGAASGAALDPNAIDWDWLAAYLTGSGLARLLLGVLNDPALTLRTPEAFRTAIAQSGMVDVMRERTLRETVVRIDSALRALGGRGVLLKGTALLMRAPLGVVSRATSDVDVLVAADLAGPLRTYLLAHGFDGAADADPSTSHHLAPVSRAGVEIEIHTRIMKTYWGLPEERLVASAEPLPPWAGCAALSTLAPEGIVLHSLVHLSASFYSFGLRSAWDVLAVLRGAPDFAWDRLAELVASCAVPRAFWAPLVALAEAVPLRVPPRLLALAPRDRASRRIERLARARLFSATEGLFELDALSKTMFVALLHAGWRGRLGFLREVVVFRASRSATWGDATKRARRADMLRQFYRQYRQFRAVTRELA
ncbi:MAG: nucleotidyltransferase family protein [Vicinamibacterales bacterium]